MTNYKPSSTPYFFLSRLNQTQGTPLPNPTHFHSLVSALQYLIFTRPDLSFAVNVSVHAFSNRHSYGSSQTNPQIPENDFEPWAPLSPQLPHSLRICKCRLGRKSRWLSLHIRLCCLLRLNPNYLGLKETKHCLSLVYWSRISEPCFCHYRSLLDSHIPQRFGGFSSRSSSFMVRQPFYHCPCFESGIPC